MYKLPEEKGVGGSEDGLSYMFITSKTASNGWANAETLISDPESIPGITLNPLYTGKLVSIKKNKILIKGFKYFHAKIFRCEFAKFKVLCFELLILGLKSADFCYNEIINNNNLSHREYNGKNFS